MSEEQEKNQDNKELEESIADLQNKLNKAYAKRFAKTKNSVELMSFISDFISSTYFDAIQSKTIMEELISRIEEDKTNKNYRRLKSAGVDLIDLKNKTDESLGSIRKKVTQIRDILMGILMQLLALQKRTDATLEMVANEEIDVYEEDEDENDISDEDNFVI